jgi:effector-binding domain-containing protein
VPARERHVTVGEVPAARVAVLVHAGDYDTIGDTYRTLGAWVARHAEHAGERVREWYVIGPLDAADVSEYRTEISWPIRTATSPTEGAPS